MPERRQFARQTKHVVVAAVPSVPHPPQLYPWCQYSPSSELSQSNDQALSAGWKWIQKMLSSSVVVGRQRMDDNNKCSGPIIGSKKENQIRSALGHLAALNTIHAACSKASSLTCTTILDCCAGSEQLTDSRLTSIHSFYCWWPRRLATKKTSLCCVLYRECITVVFLRLATCDCNNDNFSRREHVLHHHVKLDVYVSAVRRDRHGRVQEKSVTTLMGQRSSVCRYVIGAACVLYMVWIY